MTESQFLISRALTVFNTQYGANIKVDDCSIVSIPPGVSADRGYEITTPLKSTTFRIRYFFKFGSFDRDGWARLEVAAPFTAGILGDEIYAIRGVMDNYWRQEGGYTFGPIYPITWSYEVLTTEDGFPIITEDGSFMIGEIIKAVVVDI